eukprot:467158-Karenia_brevis.AAC.1
MISFSAAISALSKGGQWQRVAHLRLCSTSSASMQPSQLAKGGSPPNHHKVDSRQTIIRWLAAKSSPS